MYADIVRELDGTYSVVSRAGVVREGFGTWGNAVEWAYRNGYHNTAWDDALAVRGDDCPECRPNGWNFTDGGLFACRRCGGSGRVN